MTAGRCCDPNGRQRAVRRTVGARARCSTSRATACPVRRSKVAVPSIVASLTQRTPCRRTVSGPGTGPNVTCPPRRPRSWSPSSNGKRLSHRPRSHADGGRLPGRAPGGIAAGRSRGRAWASSRGDVPTVCTGVTPGRARGVLALQAARPRREAPVDGCRAGVVLVLQHDVGQVGHGDEPGRRAHLAGHQGGPVQLRGQRVRAFRTRSSTGRRRGTSGGRLVIGRTRRAGRPVQAGVVRLGVLVQAGPLRGR